jgi:hypothetical protein
MNRQQIKEAQKHLKKENAKYPDTLKPVPVEQWPVTPPNFTKPIEVWRSKNFMVQVFSEGLNTRLSINRPMIDNKGCWLDNIKWEDMQEIKHQVGYGDFLAVEIFPRDKDVVNVANMRHLWIIDNLDIGWKK